MASLGAIFAELGGQGDEPPGLWPHLLAIATVVLSWCFIHTIFALHYAYDFYGEGKRANGLKFPGDDKPDYGDFIYFSFVVGMTFQVSDVAVTNKCDPPLGGAARHRVVLLHHRGRRPDGEHGRQRDLRRPAAPLRRSQVRDPTETKRCPDANEG